MYENWYFQVDKPLRQEVETYKPLEDQTDNKKSDHLTLKASARVKNLDIFTYRKFTKEGEERFKEGLLNIDWQREFKDTEDNPTELVGIMQGKLDELTERCFQNVTRTIKSTDPPWITKAIKKQIKTRKRVYEKGRKRTDAWKIEKAKSDKMIGESKKRFFDKQTEKLTEKGCHTLPYHAIKMLKTTDNPKLWDVRDIRPMKIL